MGRTIAIAAAIVGLLAELVIVLVVMQLLGQHERVLLAFLSLALAGSSLYMWRDPNLDWVSGPSGCLKFVALTPAGGAVMFCFDMILGQILHPLTNPFEAAMRTGPMGGALTVIATPLMEVVAIGSLVRSFLLTSLRRPA